MGALDFVKTAVDNLDKKYNPLRTVADALPAVAPDASDTTPQQKAYEAKERAANKNNPSYPGNVDIKQVDDSVEKKAF